MRVIYLDILVLMNFYITYFLIAGTSCMLHRDATFKRRLIGSGIGAAFSLAIFLPPLPLAVNLVLKLIMSAVIVLISMGFCGIRIFLNNTLVFFLTNCLYAGVMLAIWLFAAPSGMMYNNGVSYFNIPLWLALVSTALSYFVIKIIRRALDSKTAFDKKYTIIIETEKGTANLTAIADSGNKLTDFFTGLPIIFCKLEKCAEICPQNVIAFLDSKEQENPNIRGIRLIPCSTVSGASTAVCFKPKKITISDGKSNTRVSALIGFTKTGISGDTDAIFNPRIL